MNRIVSFLVFLCLFVSSGSAQHSARGKAAPDAADKLTDLKVTGTTRYTDKEILAASRLEMGQLAAEGDFKEAVQRLGDSGMFSEVLYSYTSSNAGVKLELQFTDVDQSKLVPARFENFVWFTDDELLSALQSRVPLFKKLLPLSGNLPDRVTEALQATLSDKGLPGRVDYLREAQDQNGGALVAITYRIEDVTILIHGFEFPGASPEQSAQLVTAAQRAIGGNYDRSALAALAKLDLRPVYLHRGYLKVAFAPSDARVLPASASDEQGQGPAEIQVDAIVPVTPGKVYSASGFDWNGNSVINASELAPLIHLPSGQPVDAIRLLSDIENVNKLYGSRGYVMAQIKPNAQFDDEKGSVHYDFNIVEGDLYRMGELEILGLDTQSTARMRNAWTLHPGQPYNSDYLKQFLDNTRDMLPRGVRWGVTTHATPEPKDKTVDVEIHFKQQ
jgi:outer membrane protein assembly factor BamA